jgi:hypothetical protein
MFMYIYKQTYIHRCVSVCIMKHAYISARFMQLETHEATQHHQHFRLCIGGKSGPAGLCHEAPLWWRLTRGERGSGRKPLNCKLWLRGSLATMKTPRTLQVLPALSAERSTPEQVKSSTTAFNQELAMR